jgi:hypothetical protein
MFWIGAILAVIILTPAKSGVSGGYRPRKTGFIGPIRPPFGGSGVKRPAPPKMRVITDGGWFTKFDTGPQVRDAD